jgi:hypothetical protein
MAIVTKRIREEYETLLRNVGESRFYSHVLSTGQQACKQFEHAEIMMLDQSDAFFSLYRTTGNCNFFIIGKILRRVAHKLYRYLREKSSTPVNRRFLNIVK